MSIEASKWLMEFAPPFPAHLYSTLSGLAWHADGKGRGAYPSVARLASYGCKTPRSVQRDLRELEEMKFIRLGDQSLADDIPADRRPPVYDLAMELRADGGTRTPAWSASGRPKRNVKRGDADDAPNGVTPVSPRNKNGVTPMAERGDVGGSNGATYTSPKPSFEPPIEPLSPGDPEEPPFQVPAADREKVASPRKNKPPTPQELVRESGVVPPDDEPAFMAWVTVKRSVQSPAWWRITAGNGDLPALAEAWRADSAAAVTRRPGVPGWCGNCGGEDPIMRQYARGNIKFRTLGECGGGELCPDCHPSRARTA